VVVQTATSTKNVKADSVQLPSNVALNPLPWLLLSPEAFELTARTVDAAARAASAAGFTAIQADVPADLSLADYRKIIDRYGLRSGPGYFPANFGEPSESLHSIVEAARKHAAIQAELGLGEVFVACHVNPTRLETPAVGAGFEAGRLELIIEQIAVAAEAIAGEGLRPCFHPHVGTWIETEHEIRALLDAVPPSALSFGPDTGHLSWAGIDPVKLLGDYADRVGAVHLKDVHGGASLTARNAGATYAETTFDRHVWCEPGRGDIDFDAVFAVLPSSYRGWFVLEVDVPDLPTKEESTFASAEWIAAHAAWFEAHNPL
jgi:inosose dehydratase